MDKKKKSTKGTQKPKNNNKLRHWVQALWMAITNSYIVGFFQGKIYGGPLKQICVPGLNCYSCPGAIGACPIGSLQGVMGSWKYKFSYYVIGFMIFVGSIFGRFICGWLCPFGLVQDLLHKIPFVKKIDTFKGDKILRYLKYVILLVFVIILPLFVVDILGQGEPFFCKWICPSGTLLGGIPLVATNESLRAIIGWLFAWKSVILIIIIVLSIILYRPFCKYICPLGAIYSFFNKISIYKLNVDKSKCISCNKCAKACKMNVNPVIDNNSLECIRCGDCKKVCPTNAIDLGFCKKKAKSEVEKTEITVEKIEN